MGGLTSTGSQIMLDLDANVWADARPDVPLNCEHSDHNRPGWQHIHGGPATHYVKAIHDCDGGAPLIYPACTPFVQYVLRMMNKTWFCPRCKTSGEGRTMVQVVLIIDH